MLVSSTGSFVARDGLEIAYTEWGSPDDHPLVVLVHATGFCKELCMPIVDDLSEFVTGFRALAIDLRAHGDSAVPDHPFDWWDIGRDIVEVVAGSSPVIGVGHSAGGAALILAELTRPGTFDGLVLVEPIVFPPPYGHSSDHTMVRVARRRRDRFASREAALSNWMSKRAFAGWEERAMRAYVFGGLREVGGEFMLKCSRESEAEFFAAGLEHRGWDRLGEINVESLVISGELSTTHQEPFVREIVSRMPNASYEVVPDTGHMVWMERPGLVAERVAGFMSQTQLTRTYPN
jgi:pimeloyl-ACP methyl ester carboxylesterase